MSAQLVVVCAYHPMSAREQALITIGLDDTRFRVTGTDAARAGLDAAVAAARGGRAHPQWTAGLITGDAVHALLETATGNAPALLVVGNRGMNRLSGRLLGSIPSDIAFRAEVRRAHRPHHMRVMPLREGGERAVPRGTLCDQFQRSGMVCGVIDRASAARRGLMVYLRGRWCAVRFVGQPSSAGAGQHWRGYRQSGVGPCRDCGRRADGDVDHRVRLPAPGPLPGGLFDAVGLVSVDRCCRPRRVHPYRWGWRCSFSVPATAQPTSR